jgi:hypothetical protein
VGAWRACSGCELGADALHLGTDEQLLLPPETMVIPLPDILSVRPAVKADSAALVPGEAVDRIFFLELASGE